MDNQYIVIKDFKPHKSERSTVNSMDPTVFLRHSDITETMTVKVDFIRDIQNQLKLLSAFEHQEYFHKVKANISKLKLASKDFHATPLSTIQAQGSMQDRGFQSIAILEKQQPTVTANTLIQDTFNFMIYVQVQLLQENQVICPEIVTQVVCSYEIDEVIVLPLRVCDLKPSSGLRLTVFSMDQHEPLATTDIQLFDQNRKMHSGTWNFDLGQKSDTVGRINKTLRDIQKWRKRADSKMTSQDHQAFKAVSEKLFQLYNCAQAFIEVTLPDYGMPVLFADSHNLYLRSKFDFPQYLVNAYSNYQSVPQVTLDSSHMSQKTSLSAYQELLTKLRFQTQQPVTAYMETQLKICKFHDPLVMHVMNDKVLEKPSPIADKFYILTREDSTPTLLQPDKEEQQQINKLLLEPDFHHLTESEKRLLWRYRHSQKNKPDALVKFLLSVDWQISQERNQAIDLMKQWAEIDTPQVLPLLSSFFSINESYNKQLTPEIILKFIKVRQHAVQYLNSKASLKSIRLVLLQLTQAMRYENKDHKTGLQQFLIDTALKDKQSFNTVHWTLFLEKESVTNDNVTKKLFNSTYDMLMSVGDQRQPSYTEDIRFSVILRNKLLALSQMIKEQTGAVTDKTQLLQKEMQGKTHYMVKFDEGLQLPHEPNVKAYGVDVKKCKIFSSSIQPMLVVFNARRFPEGWQEGQVLPKLEFIPAMLKNGDDMRQDQIVLQVIKLVDSLLKDIQLDFQFTAYSLLACSKDDGIMEFVPSSTIQKIQEDTKRDVSQYLKDLSKDPVVERDILQTYLQSNAGYAVVTYLLAIGDRHLENLMLTAKGHLFHIDFGFILGRNPPKKGLWVPHIRINKPMVLGMGGLQSKGYETFKQKTIDAFLYLRNSRHLILNIFFMMIDAGMPDLPSSDHHKILGKLNDRFLPELSNEEARQRFTEILDESVNAQFAEFLEHIHILSVKLKY